MRFERRAREPSRPVLGAAIGGALVATAALPVLWLRLGLPRPLCQFRSWTGIPCPTCGSTRMIEALLAGDILGAFSWNPLVFFALTVGAVWAMLSTVRVVFGLPAWRVVMTSREWIGLVVLAAVVFVAGWSYLIWRGA